MPHHNTILNQLLRFVSRHEFESLAKEHHIGRKLRKVSRWSQFNSLLVGQVTGRQSLRDIESTMRSQQKRLYHAGVQPVARTSLARLNEQQPYQLYEALFQRLYKRCKQYTPNHSFSFKHPLYSLDASLIDLSLKLFPWSHYALGKEAVKLQLGLDHSGHIPAFAAITDSRQSDCAYAKTLTLPKGSMVVFDRGYSDYEWYKTLHIQGIYYVTRQRSNAKYQVISRQLVDQSTEVTSDQIIRFTSDRSKKKVLPDMRRIGFYDHTSKRHYYFITNHKTLEAETIAEIYKQRWQVELFFKWIKQNLHIKSFLGTSRNAVFTQIWVALCVNLLLAYIKFSSRVALSLQKMIRLLQLNLFSRRDLLDLFTGKPPDTHQHCLQARLAL